jgi:hypothetical protein
VADNLGLRALLERVIASGNIMTNLKAGNLEQVRKIAFVLVNAETEINPQWDQFGSIPPFAAMIDSYSSISGLADIRRGPGGSTILIHPLEMIDDFFD